MKQKQPKFSGILVVAVLMVLVLFIVSLSPLLAASGSKDTTYSEIYYYFENQQVTSFRLDLGTGSLELWLKEGKAALPESNAAASLPTGGLLTGVYSSDDKPAYNAIFRNKYGFRNDETFDGLHLLQPRLGFTYDFNDDALAIGASYWVTLAEQQLPAPATTRAAA